MHPGLRAQRRLALAQTHWWKKEIAMSQLICPIAVDWATFSSAVQQFPEFPELQKLLRLAFYSGNASSLARVLSCPSKVHWSGQVVIDAEIVRTMKEELDEFMVNL